MPPHDTGSEQHRAACEARWLASRSVEKIESYLDLVEQNRGKDAAEKLRNDARTEWRRIKGKGE